MSFRSRTLTAVLAAGASLALVVGCGSAAQTDASSTDDGSGSAAASTTDDGSGNAGTVSGDQVGDTDAPDGSQADGSATDGSAADTTGDADADATTDGSSSSDGSTDATATEYPVTIDAANGAVTLESQPTAIISLSPTATEMIYAIGAGDQVVAADTYSNYPEGVPNSVIDSYSLNIEALTGYEPDLIVMSRVSDEQLEKLDTLSIPVLETPSATDLDDVYEQIDELGLATGHVDTAADLQSSMKEQIADIVDSAPDSADSATYYYELTDSYYSATSETFIGQVLGLIGLQSIADEVEGVAESGGYPQLNAEFILDADPDYIFLSDTGRGGQSAETVAARPGWDTLSAVTGDRVVGLDDNIASRWGPRIVDLLATVSDAVKANPVQ